MFGLRNLRRKKYQKAHAGGLGDFNSQSAMYTGNNDFTGREINRTNFKKLKRNLTPAKRNTIPIPKKCPAICNLLVV